MKKLVYQAFGITFVLLGFSFFFLLFDSLNFYAAISIILIVLGGVELVFIKDKNS